MTPNFKIFLLILTLAFIAISQVEAADDKFCGVVIHDLSTGKMHRNTAEVDRYKALWPLPKIYNPVEWQVDHIEPLVCGGCDTITNMAWMPKSIKTCAVDNVGKVLCKDRYEQKVFCTKPVAHTYVK